MPPKHVTLIQDGRIVTSAGRWPRRFVDDVELAREVAELIDQGFAFVDQPAGWPPAAVVRDLQERGLLQRPFTAITWRGPDDFYTYPVAAT